MNYKLLIEPQAELDLLSACRWYEERTQGLGSEFMRAVEVCLSSIQRNLLAYPIVYKKVRRSLVRAQVSLWDFLSNFRGNYCSDRLFSWETRPSAVAKPSLNSRYSAILFVIFAGVLSCDRARSCYFIWK